MRKSEKHRLVVSIALALFVAVILLHVPFHQVSTILHDAMEVVGTPFICGAIIGILNKRNTLKIAIGFAVMAFALIFAEAFLLDKAIEPLLGIVVMIDWIIWACSASRLMRWLEL